LAAIDFHIDLHSDGGTAEAEHAREKAHHVTHQYGLMEFNPINGDGNQERRRATSPHNFSPRANGAGLIEVAKNDAAKYGSMRVRVAWHHHHLDGEVSVCHEGNVHQSVSIGYSTKNAVPPAASAGKIGYRLRRELTRP
jgi:hypothetical protein